MRSVAALLILVSVTLLVVGTSLSLAQPGGDIPGGGSSGAGAKCSSHPDAEICAADPMCNWVTASNVCAEWLCDQRPTAADCQAPPSTGVDTGCFWTGEVCSTCIGAVSPCPTGCVEVAQSDGGLVSCQRDCSYLPPIACNSSEFNSRCQIQQTTAVYDAEAASCVGLPRCHSKTSDKECSTMAGCAWNDRGACTRFCGSWESEWRCMSWQASAPPGSQTFAPVVPPCQWDQRKDPASGEKQHHPSNCVRRPDCSKHGSNQTACALDRSCAWDFGRRSAQCRTYCAAMVHPDTCALLGSSCYWKKAPPASTTTAAAAPVPGGSSSDAPQQPQQPPLARCMPVGVKNCPDSRSPASCFGAEGANLACKWDHSEHTCGTMPCALRSQESCTYSDTIRQGLNCFPYTVQHYYGPNVRGMGPQGACGGCGNLPRCSDSSGCEASPGGDSCRRRCWTINDKSLCDRSDYCYSGDSAVVSVSKTSRVVATCFEKTAACNVQRDKSACVQSTGDDRCFWLPLSGGDTMDGVCINKCDRICNEKECRDAGACEWNPTAPEGARCHISCYVALKQTRPAQGGSVCYLNLSMVHSYSPWRHAALSPQEATNGNFFCQVLQPEIKVQLFPKLGALAPKTPAVCGPLPICAYYSAYPNPSDREGCIAAHECFAAKGARGGGEYVCANRCATYRNPADCEAAVLSGGGASPCFWANGSNTCNATVPQTPAPADAPSTTAAASTPAPPVQTPAPAIITTGTGESQQPSPSPSSSSSPPAGLTTTASPRSSAASSSSSAAAAAGTTVSATSTMAPTTTITTSEAPPHTKSNITYAPGKKEPSTVIAAIDPKSYNPQQLQKALAEKLGISPGNIVLTRINETYVEISFIGVDQPGDKVLEVVGMSPADLKRLNLTSVQAGPSEDDGSLFGGVSKTGALVGVIILGVALLIGLVVLKRWYKNKYGGGSGGAQAVGGGFEGHTQKFALDYDDEDLMSQDDTGVELLSRAASV